MLDLEDSEVERLAGRINNGLDGISIVVVLVIAIAIGLTICVGSSILWSHYFPN